MRPGWSSTCDWATGKTSRGRSHPGGGGLLQAPHLTQLQAAVVVLIQQLEEVQRADLHCAHRFLVLLGRQDLAALQPLHLRQVDDEPALLIAQEAGDLCQERRG